MLELPLGHTGRRVSVLALGTMTWGRDIDEVTARELLTMFVQAGGTLIDTSCAYSDGDAEVLVGRLLRELDLREQVTVITKAGIRRGGETNTIENSRATVLSNLTRSAERLDGVDVALISSPDHLTAGEEIAATLVAAVNAGLAHFAGLSNFTAWQTAHIATLTRTAGLRLACVENEYSLLQRGCERELWPAAHALGLGAIAWAGLGRGVLTGKYRRTIPPDSRAASAHLAGFVQPYLTQSSAAVVDALTVAAKGLGCTPAEVALAWQRSRQITSTVVGPRTPAHLRQILASLDVELPAAIAAALTEISAPAL